MGSSALYRAVSMCFNAVANYIDTYSYMHAHNHTYVGNIINIKTKFLERSLGIVLETKETNYHHKTVNTLVFILLITFT